MGLFLSTSCMLLWALGTMVTQVCAAADAIVVPAKPGANASNIVQQDFLGFATEAASFPNFTYAFSQNLFNVFYEKTGVPVIFRVGGTSMDHSIFDLNQEEDWKHPHGEYNGLQSNMTFGKNWFRGFGSLENLVFMLHVPLARYNETNAVKFTQKCLETMRDAKKLHTLEIGNEVDAYSKQLNDSYPPRAYAKDVKRYMNLITNNVTMFPKSGRIFQIFDKGTEIDWPTRPEWKIHPFIGNVTEIVDMSRVRSISEHYYQAHSATSTLQGDLLNHDKTVSMTRIRFQPELDVIRQHDSLNNVDFVISEVGNAIGSTGSISDNGLLSSSLGSAVWTVDWMLYTMSINVTRINMQMGREFAFAAWQPNKVEKDGKLIDPHLLGGFYGHVFVADFIGKKGNLQIKQLPQPSGKKHVSAYAGYHSGKLSKVALTNQELWNSTEHGSRPTSTVTLDLKGLGSSVKQVKMEKLWAPSGDDMKNISWAGMDWPYNNKTGGGGLPVKKRNDTEMLNVSSDGTIKITMDATTAALISW